MMPVSLQPDPIMSAQYLKEVGGINDDQIANNLINIVSDKFREYTNRVAINEGSIVEALFPYDGNALFVHATPIAASPLVTVIENYRDGSTPTTHLESNNDIIVDREWGRILRVGGDWDNRQGFRNFQVTYTGGWATVPDGVLAGALAQIKVENDRIKGNVGYDSITTGGDTVTLDRFSLIKEAEKAWMPFKVFA